ncbi:LOW QUALITY PROTEIN: WAS/WASL-interacting protein family member 2 [Anser cygnoides]|uniref:LOW QUALITY PROTEIN: WAS/WASL-interacting protein family member 2 n=1 Tax=Anser cygnoides TaxID=8845 RepID=UPI0034D368A3
MAAARLLITSLPTALPNMAARPPQHGAAAGRCPSLIRLLPAQAQAGRRPPFCWADGGAGPRFRVRREEAAGGAGSAPALSSRDADPPPPPPPPPGPPPPPTFSQANTEPPKLSREEQRGRGALLQDICKGTKLRKVTQINDRSAPILEKPKGGCGGGYGAGSAAIQPKGGLFQGGVPKLRPVGAKESSDGSAKQTPQAPGSRAAAPRPPVPAGSSRPQDDADGSRGSPPELPRTQRPSLPDLSRPSSAAAAGATGMKHSSSAPPPPPPGRRSAAPPAPGPKIPSYNREKPLPPTPGQRPPPGRDGPPAPPPGKPPPSPVSHRTGAQGQALAPPPPPYRQPPGVPNGPSSPVAEAAPELPQRHNSLHRKAPGPLRGLAPPPPAAASPSLQGGRPPPPARDPPSRAAGGRETSGASGERPHMSQGRMALSLSPPHPAEPGFSAPPGGAGGGPRPTPAPPPSPRSPRRPPPPLLRNGGRDAPPPPPPPPYRLHGSSEPPGRGKPPPPPTRTPAGPPPPPPPPVRNGHRDSIAAVRALLDDFEAKYSFHPVEDFPAPEEYKYFQRIYPSKSNRATRGAPPLPPIPR